MGCCSGKWPPAPPTFHLLCDLWEAPTAAPPFTSPPLGPDQTDVPCAITPGEIIHDCIQPTITIPYMFVKFPAGTDVHWQRGMSPQGDVLEIPPSSGMWYKVYYVFDVAKGFPNEYRMAQVVQQVPIPNPLP